VVVAVGVALFVFFWPVLTGDRITYEAWQHRMWFRGWI
jgi:dolichyl-phosphate-mannose-protein mannosyltransferase